MFRYSSLLVVGLVVLFQPSRADACRLIYQPTEGRSTFGSAVPCSYAGGFVHWSISNIQWYLNPANQGSDKAAALQSAMASWNNVTPATYNLTYAGTTTGGFVTDGQNTVSWGIEPACGSCLALTAIVVGPNQTLQETDIIFNNSFQWNTNGSDYDVWAIAAHELGHSLGIHHTDLNKGGPNRPTMYSQYFGLNGRTLEIDDVTAVNCIYNRYPPLP